MVGFIKAKSEKLDMAVLCFDCGKELQMQFTCKFCGKHFCQEHQLPENHSCSGMERWQEEKIASKTKAGKKNIQYMFKENAPQGYFPKEVKRYTIKTNDEAEVLAEDTIQLDSNRKVKDFESIESHRKSNELWVVSGIAIIKKFLGTKKVKFEVSINAEDGKILNLKKAEIKD